jgi:hypothetical protein
MNSLQLPKILKRCEDLIDFFDAFAEVGGDLGRI